jgi:hypothetical protein
MDTLLSKLKAARSVCADKAIRERTAGKDAHAAYVAAIAAHKAAIEAKKAIFAAEDDAKLTHKSAADAYASAYRTRNEYQAAFDVAETATTQKANLSTPLT